MSDQTSALPGEPTPAAPPPGRARRGGTIAVVASVVGVLVVAGGAFAAWRFLAGGGPRPAEVLPASTFAVVSVDLDPSGGQKIEAIRTLRKFPSFREHTGVRPDSDVVKAIWDDTVGKACTKVDYADDVKPWIGQRAAFGGVELEKDTATPVVAVQVRDKDAAAKGFAKLADCARSSGQSDFGYTVGDDYAVVSDSTSHARAILAAGEKSPLSQDAAYQKWTDEAGGPGIFNGFVSDRGAELLSEELSGSGGAAGATGQDQLDKALGRFRGAGATLRFHDGGLELSVAGGGIEKVSSSAVGDHVAALPENTAALLGGALDGKKIGSTLDEALSGFGSFFGAAGDDEVKSSIEEETGLRLPDDVATLLGTSFSLSVGGNAPPDLDKVHDLSDVPAGYLVRGDDAAVKDVVDRVQQHTGLRLADIPATFDTADGKAVLATSPDYAEQLLAKGSLGDDETFQDVVPHADSSAFVLYLSLDNGWSDTLAKAARNSGDKSAEELAADVEALRALGASAWTEGSTGHALVRVTAR